MDGRTRRPPSTVNHAAMDQWPLRGSVAMARGQLTRNDLRTRYRLLFRDTYVAADTDITALVKARAAALATGAVLAGYSAAAVLGTKWLTGDLPAHIVRADRHSRPGLIAHSWRLDDQDVCRIGEVRLTTPLRTAFDIGRTMPPAEAIPILDALCRATRTAPAGVLACADEKRGVPGVRRLRTTMELVDAGAESPQETRVRLLLVAAGLPAPETQIEFRDLRLRVDMGWREWKVAVEYDGIQHWSDARQRAWDIERVALLEAAGWAVIRVSAAMLRRPELLVTRVRDKLLAAGCPL